MERNQKIIDIGRNCKSEDFETDWSLHKELSSIFNQIDSKNAQSFIAAILGALETKFEPKLKGSLPVESLNKQEIVILLKDCLSLYKS